MWPTNLTHQGLSCEDCFAKLEAGFGKKRHMYFRFTQVLNYVISFFWHFHSVTGTGEWNSTLADTVGCTASPRAKLVQFPLRF